VRQAHWNKATVRSVVVVARKFSDKKVKDKKILIVIIVAAIVCFALFFSSRPIEKNRRDINADITTQTNIDRLESQVQQLRGLFSAFAELNRSLSDSLQKESAQRKSLEQTLNEVNAQYESLIKELDQAKISLELTLPIKGGIEKIEKSLAQAEVSPGKEKELKQKLQNIKRQLQLIDAQIPALLKENTSYYKRLSETLKGLLEKQHKDMDALRSALAEEKIRKESFKKAAEDLKMERRKSADLERTKDNLMQANASLHTQIHRLTSELKDSRAKLSRTIKEEEAKNLKRTNQQLEEQLLGLNAQLARLQKDSAGLQNEYVVMQEALKDNETALGRRADKILALEEKLADAQTKLSGIQSGYNELEKQSAGLREQIVAVQIDREELKSQLGQSTLKVSDLENQLAQIGIILKTPKSTEAPASKEEPKEETKRVEVDLFPDETNETRVNRQ
jgi:chromosome segregation ATPase